MVAINSGKRKEDKQLRRATILSTIISRDRMVSASFAIWCLAPDGMGVDVRRAHGSMRGATFAGRFSGAVRSGPDGSGQPSDIRVTLFLASLNQAVTEKVLSPCPRGHVTRSHQATDSRVGLGIQVRRRPPGIAWYLGSVLKSRSDKGDRHLKDSEPVPFFGEAPNQST